MKSKNIFNTKIAGYILLILAGLIIILYFFFMDIQQQNGTQNNSASQNEDLTAEQKHVLFEQGTEAPFSSDLLNEKRVGTYYAADTKEPVFRSEDKFDSGTGWPSFTRPVNADAVKEHTDETLGMTRIEVTSSEGGHLGHVFSDGPKEETGLRYCINGDALYFVPDEEKKSE